MACTSLSRLNACRILALPSRCTSKRMGHRFCRRFHPPLIVDPSGSGKTFTMGSEYKPGGRSYGVIPEAIGAIFQRIATIKDYECCVRVSFVEIHKVRPSVLHTRPPARSRSPTDRSEDCMAATWRDCTASVSVRRSHHSHGNNRFPPPECRKRSATCSSRGGPPLDRRRPFARTPEGASASTAP